MTYSASDFSDDICAALKVEADSPEMAARLALAALKAKDDELAALRIVAGIRKPHTHEEAAQNGLTLLLAARRCFREAKADKTLGRLASTISSAKGAVRAGSYRDARATEAQTKENAS